MSCPLPKAVLNSRYRRLTYAKVRFDLVQVEDLINRLVLKQSDRAAVSAELSRGTPCPSKPVAGTHKSAAAVSPRQNRRNRYDHAISSSEAGGIASDDPEDI